MLRQTLGNFSSVVCLKAIITGREDALANELRRSRSSRQGGPEAKR